MSIDAVRILRQFFHWQFSLAKKRRKKKNIQKYQQQRQHLLQSVCFVLSSGKNCQVCFDCCRHKCVAYEVATFSRSLNFTSSVCARTKSLVLLIYYLENCGLSQYTYVHNICLTCVFHRWPHKTGAVNGFIHVSSIENIYRNNILSIEWFYRTFMKICESSGSGLFCVGAVRKRLSPWAMCRLRRPPFLPIISRLFSTASIEQWSCESFNVDDWNACVQLSGQQ